MATAQSVKAKLQGLIDSANAATGGSDTTLDAAVGTLIAGFGAGGGSSAEFEALVKRTITEVDYAGTFIGAHAFRTCIKLTRVNAENVVTINENAFAGCSLLEEINIPNCENVYGSAFGSCTVLRKLNLPKMTNYYSGSIANGCTALEEVDLPVYAGALQTQSFKTCRSLVDVNIPKVTGISTYAFQSCTSLMLLDLPAVTKIDANAFYGASKLNTIVLRSETVCTLSSTTAFTSTPFASSGTGGTVYVPSALITQYQQATNWSTLYAAGTCNFAAIEGSEYE